MIRLAIVCPCFNEHEVLPSSAERLTKLLDSLVQQRIVASSSFVLLVNDGSQDNTWDIIAALHAQNTYFYGINLAHNVGHQQAIMAGMMTAVDLADAVITMDCDLQDDINAIPKMIDLHTRGYDIVYGVKTKRETDPWTKRVTAQLFYRFQSGLGVDAVYNHADFRFMSRRALQALAQFPERNIYLRGMVPLLGFRSTTVDDVISSRQAGQSKYTFSRMLHLATDGITSFSVKPMTMLIGCGVGMMVIALAVAVYVIISLATGHYVSGWSSLMLSVWFIGAVLTIGCGIIGTYIGRIYTEVKHRPLYIIADKLIPQNPSNE